MRTLMRTADARAAVAGSVDDLPDDVRTWLARLVLLDGLPFDVVVPDARMLPAESIRFFFLDQNWIDALLDGALSIVTTTELDVEMLGALRPGARSSARAAAGMRRRTGSARAAGAAPEPPPPPWTGFLLRSAAVADWPGLVVRATDETGAGLEPLRIDRPAPGLMVAIFGGIAHCVTIAKPTQGLHFGVEDDPSGPGAYRVYLRGLGGDVAAGTQPPGDPFVQVPLRPDESGRKVLDVGALQAALVAGLEQAYAPDPAPSLGPAGFGLQMVASGEVQLFDPGVARAEPGSGTGPPPDLKPRRSATVSELVERLSGGR